MSMSMTMRCMHNAGCCLQLHTRCFAIASGAVVYFSFWTNHGSVLPGWAERDLAPPRGVEHTTIERRSRHEGRRDARHVQLQPCRFALIRKNPHGLRAATLRCIRRN